MKLFIGGVLALCSALFGLVLPVGALTNDFRFISFEADYYLNADSDGRSTLKTVETLVAEFPITDQNHGIERAIPKKYDDHPTSLRIDSVVNESGGELEYTTYDSNDNLVLRIGNPDTYVHGRQTYRITYTQRDVTKLFYDTDSDEFYWDTNGTEWLQPFGSVTARVHLSDRVAPTFNEKIACYQGREGVTGRCSIEKNGNIITARTDNLASGENMTVAIGFTVGTFRGYEPSVWDRIVDLWVVTLVITSIGGFFSLFWLSFKYSRINDRTKELDPVPVEYIPPKGVSVLTVAKVGDDTKAEMTAQIIDLAVRHFITITQTKEKSLFKAAEYRLEIVKSVDRLTNEEKEFITTIFGSSAIGTKLETKTFKDNYSLFAQLRKNTKSLNDLIKGEYNLRAKDETKSKTFKKIGFVLLSVSLIGFSPLMLVAAAVAFGCAYSLTPLTDKGLDLRRYIAGLKVYIEAAEKERLAMLQSPEGAEKIGIAVKDEGDAKLVKLYERTLPYAVLFGQEKEWNKQLGALYENNGSHPDWYVGHGAFNAAVFTSAMNDFSGNMNSYGASTSSSSGGSSGGGSSGGGGGGGGGGGW